MNKWSIHSEGGKFVVRMTAKTSEQREEYEKQVAEALKTGETVEVGELISTHTSWKDASQKVYELEDGVRQEAKIAAAKELLRV